MAQLNIYADCTTEKPTKTYICRRVLSGVIHKITKYVQEMDGKTQEEQFAMLGEFARLIFPALTDEELQQLDVAELQVFFKDILAMAQGKVQQAQKN